MAYKVQTNRVKAFIVQDLSLLVGTLVFIVVCGYMFYVHIASAGESCGRDGRIMNTCSPVWAYAFFGPVAILATLMLIRFLYNLFKIGTVSPIYLKYRNFSGDQVSVNQTVSAVEPTVEEKKMTEFPYAKFIKLNIYFMFGAALVFTILPVPSWVNVLIIYAIPLFANVFSISIMRVNKTWSLIDYVFRRNKQPIVPLGNNDSRAQKYFELQADVAKSKIKMIGILLLMAIVAMFLSAISVGIKQSIYK